MPHDIATHGNGQRSCYSLRDHPWHRLGAVVDRPVADPDLLTLAGLAWEPQRRPIYTDNLDPVPNHLAICRSDDQRVLGVVGQDYTPLPNTDLIGFLREASGWGDLTIETAGALGQGETVWMLARVPDLDLIMGDDYSEGYLLISNNHVGRQKLIIQPTQVRVVCRNTLNLALGKRSKRRQSVTGRFAIRHTSGLNQALADAAQAYAGAIHTQRAIRVAVEHLAGVDLTARYLQHLIDRAFGPVESGPDETNRANAMRKTREERISEILESPTCRVNGTAGSLWAGFNAITEYVDHERPTRTLGKVTAEAQRFASSIWGSGASIKHRAWEAALALA